MLVSEPQMHFESNLLTQLAVTSIQFNNTASGEKAAETVKRALQPLRELTPRSGAYINEVSLENETGRSARD